MSETKKLGRCFVVTVHETNMVNAGLSKEKYENPEVLANHFISIWESSKKERTAAIAVCRSANGTYHAHMACYGNTTTVANVAKVLCDSHVELQKGSKKALIDYLTKVGKFGAKGETVLYTKGLDNVKDKQGKRSDLDEVIELIKQGYTPKQIYNKSPRFRLYERYINKAFLDKRLAEAPVIKKTCNVWHFGDSGTGKTYTCLNLYNNDGKKKDTYLLSDLENGGLDRYIEDGIIPVLVIDDVKSELLRHSSLINMLSQYSRAQSHCRFSNTFNLWEEVHITSLSAPEELYEEQFKHDKKGDELRKQLLGRLDEIVYHYIENGEYKSYSMPAKEYKNCEDLKRRALADKNGFMKVTDDVVVPFEKKAAV